MYFSTLKETEIFLNEKGRFLHYVLLTLVCKKQFFSKYKMKLENKKIRRKNIFK